MVDQQTAREHLLTYGIKPSPQRVAIMHFLLCNPIHPTVEEIYMGLLKSYPSLSKTTVYNTLHLFVSANAVLRLWVDENCTRYDGDLSRHAHFTCTSCGKIVDITLPSMETIYTKEIEGMKIHETQIYYRGYCQQCDKRINTQPNI